MRSSLTSYLAAPLLLLAGCMTEASIEPGEVRIVTSASEYSAPARVEIAVENRTGQDLRTSWCFGFERRVDSDWVSADFEECPGIGEGPFPDGRLAKTHRQLPVGAPPGEYRVVLGLGMETAPWHLAAHSQSFIVE